MRNILLIEPNYKNKYPPIGLMKIATYHRLLGDNVKFFKGDLRDIIIEQLYEECLIKLNNIDTSIKWTSKSLFIKDYIKGKRKEVIDKLSIDESPYVILIIACLNDYADIFKKKLYKTNPKWDRIYVTTLFTFYWKITIETIEFAKYLVKDPKELLVGGVMASLLHKEIEAATGIKPHQGLLDKPGMLDPEISEARSIIIDDLPLDYSILDEIGYEYPTRSAYFTFMTKGCTRKCAFCSVPILEPTYKPKIETKDKFFEIKKKFGEQQNLLLMDNNVLASPNFLEIIEEIKEMGFVKGAVYIEPNQLDIAVRNLKEEIKSNNTKGYVNRCVKLMNGLLVRLKGAVKQDYYDILSKYELLKMETATKENVLSAYEELENIFENNRSKTSKLRYVDFNQGTDARYVTEEIMKKMSEIPIRPLRLAFDYIGIKEKYINAVKLAAKYGIAELSNYLLYNFKDSPEDLYNRMAINIKLNEELGTKIFSFPMKYIPLFGEEAKGREYIGPKWNKKFIRAIQSVLNVTKGIVAPGRTFFEKAFGKTIEEFHEILYLPERYIIYRSFFEEHGITEMWLKSFRSLTEAERAQVYPIIESNDFRNYENYITNEKLLNLLNHFRLKKEQVEQKDRRYRELKRQFDKLIKEDQFINLTLTYDFGG
jgi:hypothetical protein